MQRVAGKPEDAKGPGQAFLCALFGPIERRTLRIRVDDDDALALDRPGARDMQCQGRLADATLLVEKRDDHGAPPGAKRWNVDSLLRGSVRFAVICEPGATQRPPRNLRNGDLICVRQLPD